MKPTQKTPWFRFFRSNLPAALAASVLGVVLAGSSPGTATAQATPDARELVPGQVLVQARAGLSDAQLNRILDRQNGRTIDRIRQIGVRIVRVPEHAEETVARALSRNPRIRFAEPNRLVAPSDSLVPNDPRFDDGWHLTRIDAPEAWGEARGNDAIVAILDTGVDGDHPDLEGKLLAGHNAADGGSNTSDVNGHGTRVAGTAAAATDNGQGVAAVGWNAAILPVRVSNRSDGVASYSAIADGITWAANQGAHVANVSYDVTSSFTVASAAQYMQNRDGTVVVAAGNSGTDPGYADSPYMLSVSATDSSDSRTSWSNYGDYIDLAAPGAGIVTTSDGGTYASASGTSFSSPVTAGVVALVRSANPALSAEELEQILKATAVKITGDDWHPYYGYGRVDAGAAVATAANEDSVDTTAPLVSIGAPADGSTVDGLVDVDVEASDNVGVRRVDLYAGGTLVGSEEVSPYAFTWDPTAVADGSTSLVAEAFDDAGNRGSTRIEVTVTNDNTDETGDGDDGAPPVVEITSPGDGDAVSGNVRIAARASDDGTVTMMRIRVDGSLLCAGDRSSLRCGWQTKHHGSGDATIQAEAEDDQGNTGSASIAVTVETKDSGGGNNGRGQGSGKSR